MKTLLLMSLLIGIGLAAGCAKPKKTSKKDIGQADATAQDDDYDDHDSSNNNDDQYATPTPTPTPTPMPIQQECYKADDMICKIELAILAQTNEYRARSGKSALTNAPKIGFASREWSKSQASRGWIGHSGFPSARMSVLSREFGNTSGIRIGAENVAMTYVRSSEPESIAREFTNMWWNSPGHRRNMLGNHQGLGVGVVQKNGGTYYYATQIFGSE